jgi:formate hydrogenlyase transcriptional activator
LCGESGVGKDLIARAIHHHSPRDGRPFVKINCTALPENLMESELFGYEKGAFTGANTTKPGKFEQADTGTVFLDEIGDVPASVQVKLLRILQEREFERLGSTRTLSTDARLIAATNRDLGAMVEAQKFRSDLYYRLNVFPLRVPALRERREDIPLLVRYFVQQFSRRMNRGVETIPSETMNTLVRYDWPGNIRELQNVIEQAVIVSTGPVLKVPLDDLRTPGSSSGHSNGRSPSGDLGKMRGVLEDAERKTDPGCSQANQVDRRRSEGSSRPAGNEAFNAADAYAKARHWSLARRRLSPCARRPSSSVPAFRYLPDLGRLGLDPLAAARCLVCLQ